MSTLSGNTIESTYGSLLRFDNFSGSSTSKIQIVDGFGNTLPVFISRTELDFRDNVDFRNATRVEGIVRTIAKKDSGGRYSGLTENVNFSAGTGIDITQAGETLTFASTSVASNKQIVYIGSPGLSTTLGRPVYWDGRWNNDPTSANAYDKLIGISNGTNTFTDGVIIGGLVNDSANTGYTEGALYLPNSGSTFTSDPTTIYSPNYIRGVGHSVGSEGIVLNPDVYFEIGDVETFYIITQSGDTLITQGGDNIIWSPL